MRRWVFLFVGLILGTGFAARAGWVCDEHPEWCLGRGSSPKVGSQVSGGSSLRLNPSAVPVEKGLGLEAIGYQGTFDFSVVKGLGRVGAGLTPANGEDTFFGPPAFEQAADFAKRKFQRGKFVSPKMTFATAVNVLSNGRKGLKRAELNLGALVRYNPLTKIGTPGGGLSAILGPFTAGYAFYKDQSPDGPFEADPRELPRIGFSVETSSVGIFLTSFAIDYSVLKRREDITRDLTTVSTLTGTLFLPFGLLTVAHRIENSSRLAYDFGSESVVEADVKTEDFGGLQINVGDHALAGLFYNYYLERELSVGLTVFF